MKLAQRLQYYSWIQDEGFKDILEFCLSYKDCLDELALFTNYLHYGYYPLDKIRGDCEILEKRIAVFKENGFPSVGINELVTIGHIDEGYTYNTSPFTPITGFDGQESKACFCPTHEDMRQYIAEKYRILAGTKPDFIWVDDDIKYFWNGVKFGCFCDACMKRFNQKTGAHYDRQTLVEAMDKPDAVELRGAFVQDISDKISELLGIIKDAILGVDPRIKTGFMTQHQGWSTFNGMSFSGWFSALGAGKGRPGEGYYDDGVPENVCIKALSTARQASEYPPSVGDIQYEVENFPYPLFQKSRLITLDECTLAMASGMNGVLLNTIKIEPLSHYDEHFPLYDAIRKRKPLWNRMQEYGEGFLGRGLYPAISSHYDRRRPLHNGETFFTTYEGTENHNIMKTYCLCHLGIPLTMDKEGAGGVILTGDLPDGYTDDELKQFLSKAVIMDGEALAALERRGLDHFTGVCRIGGAGDSVYEHFNPEEEISQGLGDTYRDVRAAFFGGQAVILKSLKPEVRIISYLETYQGKCLGISASLFENKLGGRVCVLGYAPWKRIYSLSRRIQMQRITDWLCRDSMDAKILTNIKGALFVRSNREDTKTMVTFINTSIDPSGEVRIALRNRNTARLLEDEGRETELEMKSRIITLPDTPAFETRVVLAEKGKEDKR
jgi:hypothetical protein